jgi:hypothetical protein
MLARYFAIEQKLGPTIGYDLDSEARVYPGTGSGTVPLVGITR